MIAALIATTASAQAPQSPTTLSEDDTKACVAQLLDVRGQNAIVMQLVRDISAQRSAYEFQMAMMRSMLGLACPENVAVSQCVVVLQARYVEAAKKVAETAAATPGPAGAPMSPLPKDDAR